MESKHRDIENGYYNFMAHFKVAERNLPYTHVSLDPPAKYYISPDDLDEFFVRYQNLTRKGIPVCLAEKPGQACSLRADFDFKTKATFGLKRQYTHEMVETIVGYYQAEIEKTIEDEDRDERQSWCVVLEKQKPRLEGDVIKDGFHLHFPHFLCEPWACEYLQRKVMTTIRDANLFAEVDTVYGTGARAIGKICDSIARNAWLMYGSSKAKSKEPFLLSFALNHQVERIPIEEMFFVEMVGRSSSVQYYLPRFLSLRTEEESTPLTASVRQNKMAYVRKKKKRTRRQVSEKDEVRILEDLRMIKDAQFLDMLNDSRADDHDDWMFVGFALYNISQGHDEGLSMWEQFSRRSAKFVEGDCASKWSSMHLGDITLGSLVWLAKSDSPQRFHEWQKTDTQSLMRASLWLPQPNELKISKVIAKIFKDRFICANPPQNLWYEFQNHRWKIDPGGTRLKIAITESIMEQYNEFLGDLTRRFTEADCDDDRKTVQKLQKKCTNVMEKIGTTRFLSNLVKMCQLQLFDEEFLEKADENKQIFGCENGVLDLELNTFRDGTPDDYLTFTCRQEYLEYDPNSVEVEEIKDYLAKVFPNPNIRNYFLDVACSCLEGGNLNKKFIVNTGDTNGGKSKTIELLEAVFGDYAINFPRELIIRGPGNSSNAPRPELARVRGRRIVTLHEVGKGECLNIGVLKAMTGNDAFFARSLHEKGREIKPMFTLFMQCNDPPRIPENDQATWYRVRVIDYQSRFDENAPWDFDEQRHTNHYQADRHLDIKSLAGPLLWMLKSRFGAYKKNGLVAPEEVLISTQNYKHANDVYQQFVHECFEKVSKCDGDKSLPYLRLPEVVSAFRCWHKDNHPSYHKDCPNKLEIKKQISRRIGPPNSKNHWDGYRINLTEVEDVPTAVVLLK